MEKEKDEIRVQTYNKLWRLPLKQWGEVFSPKKLTEKPTVRPSVKLVWVSFHNHAGSMKGREGYYATISISRIAKETGLGTRTVQRAIKVLIKLNLIKRIEKGLAGGAPSIWKVKHFK